MNNTIPGWDFESDTCFTNQRKPTGLDHELVELLWQNGQVVMHSQANRKLPGNSSNLRQMQKTTLRTSEPNLDQEEAAPWIQYPLDDPLEQGLCSNLLSELPPPCEVESYYKPIRELEEEKFANIFSPSPSQENLMSAPGLHVPDSSQKINDFGASRKVLNFPHFSAPRNVSSPSQKTAVNLSQSVAREHSVITVGSSHCSSNHIPQDQGVNRVSSSGVWATTTNNTTLSAEPDAVDCIQRPAPRNERGKSEMIEPTVTSSSGGCGNTGIGRTCSLSTREHGRKRKGTEEEALEEQSEATELKSADGNKISSQRSRRNRAAEVHNLSERRRRDRINDKMKALQQLIPNSNKTDKASMLEEAIEYLKSLQFQLQVMCMGAGMTPVMFPGIQHYMSQMQLPKVGEAMSLTQPQMPNQNHLLCQNPLLGAFNYQNLMQKPCLSEQYARYMGYHLMHSASQPMNALRHGSEAMQHSETMIAGSNNSSGPMSGTANVDDAVSGKTGSSTFN